MLARHQIVMTNEQSYHSVAQEEFVLIWGLSAYRDC